MSSFANHSMRTNCENSSSVMSDMSAARCAREWNLSVGEYWWWWWGRGGKRGQRGVCRKQGRTQPTCAWVKWGGRTNSARMLFLSFPSSCCCCAWQVQTYSQRWRIATRREQLKPNLGMILTACFGAQTASKLQRWKCVLLNGGISSVVPS